MGLLIIDNVIHIGYLLLITFKWCRFLRTEKLWWWYFCSDTQSTMTLSLAAIMIVELSVCDVGHFKLLQLLHPHCGHLTGSKDAEHTEETWWTLYRPSTRDPVDTTRPLICHCMLPQIAGQVSVTVADSSIFIVSLFSVPVWEVKRIIQCYYCLVSLTCLTQYLYWVAKGWLCYPQYE